MRGGAAGIPARNGVSGSYSRCGPACASWLRLSEVRATAVYEMRRDTRSSTRSVIDRWDNENCFAAAFRYGWNSRVQ